MENELKHYGVLGMKWGIHRAKVNAAKAKRTSDKGDSKKAARYAAKSKKSAISTFIELL